MNEERVTICEDVLATRPLLYNDTLGRQEIHRDDMWAVTTAELNKVHALRAQLNQAVYEMEKAKQERNRAEDKADVQSARMAAMEKALEPFAEAFHNPIEATKMISLHHLRMASEALGDKK